MIKTNFKLKPKAILQFNENGLEFKIENKTDNEKKVEIIIK